MKEMCERIKNTHKEQKRQKWMKQKANCLFEICLIALLNNTFACLLKLKWKFIYHLSLPFLFNIYIKLFLVSGLKWMSCWDRSILLLESVYSLSSWIWYVEKFLYGVLEEFGIVFHQGRRGLGVLDLRLTWIRFCVLSKW